MYLLDTNVLSDLRRRPGSLATWLEPLKATDLFVSVVTLAEITKGATLIERWRDRRTAAVLFAWIDAVRSTYEGQLLPVCERVALEWGRLEAQRPRGLDAPIAATARVHGLTVVTRNTADFRDIPINVIDPWTSA